MSGAALDAPSRSSLLPATLVVGVLALLVSATFVGRGVAPAAALVVLVSLVAAAHRFLLRWDVLVASLVIVVLAIPIKRYEFAVSLPFDLEPYRIFLAMLIGLWIGSLLVDPAVTLRRSAFDRPLLFILFVALASVVVNPETITRFDLFRSIVGSDKVKYVRDANVPYLDVSGTVAKALLFLLSVYLAYYFVVSVVRTPRAIHAVLKALVAGTAVVAVSAIVERRTGYNVFDHLQGNIPLIRFEGGLDESNIVRGSGRRVYASAQHPIALAALFVMVLPLSIYLAAQTRRFLWYATSVPIALGAVATVSRTSVTMLATVGIVAYAIRPAVMKKAAVYALPALIVVHLAVPGAIGSLRQSFFPSQGLVSDQTVYGGRLSSERLDPQFQIIEQQPALGQGYGTRITSGEGTNARVLDNQWLGTAVETGLLGVFGWLWLFARFARTAGGAARRDLSSRGWLLMALTSSVVAFAVGMVTFDALSFIQAMFVFFLLLALGASTLAWKGAWPEPARPRQVSVGPPASPAPR